MGLIRLLVWIVIIVAAIWLWRRYFSKPAKGARKQEDATPRMVRCEQCGVHVPQSTALEKDGNWYCSRAHLEQDDSTRQ